MGSSMCLLSLMSVPFGGWPRSRSPPLDSGVGGGIETGVGEVLATEDVVGGGISEVVVVLVGVVVGKSKSPNLFSGSGVFVESAEFSDSRVDSDALGEPPVSPMKYYLCAP
jgi:hypothetical protein